MPPPYLTRDFAGIGGVIRQRPEDFFVQELPLYEPSGEGEHLYCEIQKVGLSTFDAIDRLARALRISSGDIGYAGMKDARAVTRQLFSIRGVSEEQLAGVFLPDLTIQWAAPHRNKLRLGHLAGNRFAIRIRQVNPTDVVRLRPMIRLLEQRGMPNYFGPQRFGQRGDNDQLGAALIREDDEQLRRLLNGNLKPVRNKKLRRLWVSALQSRIFNDIVAARIDALDRLMDGDLAWKHDSGACFRIERAGDEQPRCDAFEISPSGPLIGYRVTLPESEPLKMEEAAFATAGLSPEDFRSEGRHKVKGARRPLRVQPKEIELAGGVDEHGPHITVAFTLPPGAFATVFLRELMKTEPE